MFEGSVFSCPEVTSGYKPGNSDRNTLKEEQTLKISKSDNHRKKSTQITRVNNPLAIEYNTKIYLFRNPKSDFNEFWKGQIRPYLTTKKL